MLRTYEGVLEGDRVRWAGDDMPATDRPLRVHVTVLDEESEPKERKSKAREWPTRSPNWQNQAHFGGVEEPIECQQEIRQERPLPGRKVSDVDD